MRNAIRAWVAASLSALLGFSGPVHSQDKIIVYSDEPLQAALEAIAPAFRSYAGHDVEYVFGPSPVLLKRIAGGAKADVLVVQPALTSGLVNSGKVAAAEHPLVARAGFGVAARADTHPRALSTAEHLRKVVLDAEALVFNDRSSGDHFAAVLARLDIAEAVKSKVVRVPPAAVFQRLGSGTGREIGVGTIPQILADKRLRLLGPLPAEYQSHIPYTAVVVNDTASAQAAKTFVEFLAGPTARAIFTKHGVE